MSNGYKELLIEAIPGVIKSEDEYERMMGIVNNLIDKEELSPDESRLLELLALLVETYESEAFPMKTQTTPRSRLKFLMEANDLKQADLVDVFGSSGRVSQVVNGKREISKEQAKRLAERFNVSVAMFI
ncbi:MAG: helix-turn-helix domain-containing protein [Acidobacteriota bacterium]|nr:MAG: helix-turn-helix domain-containing protein [Acidobacteriota bacterium]